MLSNSKFRISGRSLKMSNYSLFTVILLISGFLNPLPTIFSKKFPDVSVNTNSCYKRFQKSIHTCSCEPYNEDYICDKPSYIKFAVSST